MSRSTVPGALDLAALAALTGKTTTHDERAQQHRPSDPAALAAEIRRLRTLGWLPRDISVALRIQLPAVLEALQERAP